MACKARRTAIVVRLDELERRTLLSSAVSSTAPDASLRLLVGFKPGIVEATAQAAIQSVGAHEVESFPDGSIVVQLNSSASSATALKRLKANPAVSYAEADGTMQAAAFYPNDPLFPELWGLNQPNNIDIDAPEAWSVTAGSPATIVAVLDTGIDLTSLEFTGHIWDNPNGGSGADGYVGDVYGWNFVSNNGDVQDDNGHGSHVAGILAATGSNNYGVVGVAWGTTIMPVKVLDASGSGTTDEAVNGIYFAVNHGARVINASWGGGPYSQAMANAIAYANQHGVVFVTAAGNDGTNNDRRPSYPGSYRLPNEIVVAAIDQFGNLASFSNYGPTTVDLGAPGVNILSTVPGGFATYSGTSMATPYVAGTVALLVGLHPEFTAAQLVQRILATIKPLPGLIGRTITGGIVDAAAAVDPSTLPPPPNSGGGTVGASGNGPRLVLGGTSGDVVQTFILATNDYYTVQGGTPQTFVAGLFRSLVGREADLAGFNYYVGLLQSGMSRYQVIQMIETSAEGRDTEVARWYQDDLGWTAPLATLKANPGVDYWASLLLVGQSDDQVLNTILSTDSFYASQGGTPTGFVTGLYHALLGRAPDPASLSYFVGLYTSGMSRTSLVHLLQNTFEARRTEVARWYQEELKWTVPLAALKVNPGVIGWAQDLPNTG
jgi:subtilisin family serine protease